MGLQPLHVAEDALTREHAEAEVYRLAASVVEDPRQGVTRLLEKLGPSRG